MLDMLDYCCDYKRHRIFYMSLNIPPFFIWVHSTTKVRII